MIGYPPPRPPPVMLDPNYPPSVAIPTSAARLQHPTWAPPHTAWSPDGSPLPPGYPVPPYYPQPSPYYRSHMMPSMSPHHMYPEYLPHHYPPPHMSYSVHPPLSTVTGAPPLPLPPPPRPVHHPDGDASSADSSPSPVDNKSRARRGRSSSPTSAGASSRPDTSTVKSPDGNTSEGEKMNEDAASILKTLLKNGTAQRSSSSREVTSQPSAEGDNYKDLSPIPDTSSDHVASP